MSVRRNTTNRLTLYRVCHTCRKAFRTTADNPFMRQLPADGKREKTCYFCCEVCWRASYNKPGSWDGLAKARRAAKEAARAPEKNRRYYEAHAEKERQRARERYWKNPEEARKDNVYQRRKRQLSQGAAVLDL